MTASPDLTRSIAARAGAARVRVAGSLAVALVAFAATAVLPADEPRSSIDASWGGLHPQGEKLEGVYQAVVDAAPDDWRIVLPATLPTVVRVRGNSQSGNPFDSVPIEVEYDPQTGVPVVLLPTDASLRSASGQPHFVVETADRTMQRGDGTILFPAESATIRGETAKLEQTGGHSRVGFWTDPDDSVVWPYDATRWGNYRVWLTYSTASPDGGIAEIEMGRVKLPVELPSTGSWYQYRTVLAGELYLAEAGKHELVVRAKKLSGDALMNLKSVVLEPWYEGDHPVEQSESGEIELHARDAIVRGVKLRYEPKPEKNTLGYWTEASDIAHWRFDVREPGLFEVEVLQGCGAGQGGSTVAVYDADTSLPFVVEDTGHFQNFVPRKIGTLKIEKPGPRFLSAKAQNIAKAAACDIRQIRLIPVKEEKASAK
ncbi:MAG TPA: hypothetical protein VGN57_07890 [Pirellulaceae bacterium]|jgi:hypothetical protein|nr:hypothetical protein [Pirellulaceae bacterium]